MEVSEVIGGPPKNHPFLDGIFPSKKPSILGYPHGELETHMLTAAIPPLTAPRRSDPAASASGDVEASTRTGTTCTSFKVYKPYNYIYHSITIHSNYSNLTIVIIGNLP